MNAELINKQWSDIPGYEGIYRIDEYGAIITLDRIENVTSTSGVHKRTRKGRLKKTSFDRYGYPVCSLMKNSISKHFTIHRLVALTFIPNPESLPQVNHIDGNKLNNHVSNLEWCNGVYNIKHAFKNGLRGVVPSRGRHYQARGVIAIKDLAIMEFDCMTDAANAIGVSKAYISKCANTKWRAKGYSISYL